MKVHFQLILLSLLAVFLAAGTVNPGYSLEQGPPPKFENVTKLTVLDSHSQNQRTFEVTEAIHIEWLVEKIQLRPKQPCMCDHRWVVTFHLAQGASIKVGLSDHSFEVQNQYDQAHFGMPAELYQRFLSLVKTYTPEP